MHLIEDHRQKKGDDDDDEDVDDAEALQLGGKNPLEEEEKIEVDDTGND